MVASSSRDPQTGKEWWAFWALTFVISLIPPLAHHLLGISHLVESYRPKVDPLLLPADLILLRFLGQLSGWVPVLLIGLLVWALRQPHRRRGIIAGGCLATAAFSSVYAAYCLVIVSMGRI